jgi:biotin carboxyl carrier protein
MKTVEIEIDGALMRLQFDRQGDQYKLGLGNGNLRDAQLIEVAPGVYSVLLDGRSYEVRAEAREDCAWITVRGRRFRVVVTDPRRWNRKGSGITGHERDNIVAPMPGKIVRLLVEPGDSVTTGQGIVVIEAMKMQNEMKSRRDGRVAALPVREGDTVGAGTVLATIE